MKIYHGSPIIIKDVCFASSSYFSDDFNVAKDYGRYVYAIDKETASFKKDTLDENYISCYGIPLNRFIVIDSQKWFNGGDTFGKDVYLPIHEAIGGIKRQNEDLAYRNTIIYCPYKDTLMIKDEHHFDDSAKSFFRCESFEEAEYFIGKLLSIDTI